jgi:hypothetical protein
MSPIKLSLWGPGVEGEQSVELDDDLAQQFRQTVDAHPDFTLDDAFRQGLQHVVDNGPMRPSLD